MSDDDKNGFVAGIYRNLEKLVPILGRIADTLDADKKQEVKAEPMEQMLLGLAQDDTKHDAPDGHYWTMPPAGEVAKAALDKPKPPRKWSNSVIVYKALWNEYGSCRTITFEDILEDCSRKLCARTGGKVGISTLPRILSALVAAGAAERVGRKGYIIAKPTDELCEAVERARSKRAAAKEVTNA